MATVTMTLEEYEALIAMIRSVSPLNETTARMMETTARVVEDKPKKRSTAYQRRYKSAFKKIAPKYKLKSGKWKAGGFKKAVKQAHKEAKR